MWHPLCRYVRLRNNTDYLPQARVKVTSFKSSGLFGQAHVQPDQLHRGKPATAQLTESMKEDYATLAEFLFGVREQVKHHAFLACRVSASVHIAVDAA